MLCISSSEIPQKDRAIFPISCGDFYLALLTHERVLHWIAFPLE